eukprot:SAG31_NODE_4827_length_2922_cov_1.410556_2_plen_55_part_00
MKCWCMLALAALLAIPEEAANLPRPSNDQNLVCFAPVRGHNQTTFAQGYARHIE